MSYQAHWGTHTVVPGSSGVQRSPSRTCKLPGGIKVTHVVPGSLGHPYSHTRFIGGTSSPIQSYTCRLTGVQRSPYSHTWRLTRVQRSPIQSYVQAHRGYKGRCDLFGLHLLPIQHLEEGMSHGCIEELETFILIRVEKLWEGGGRGNGIVIRVQSSTRFRGCAHV